MRKRKETESDKGSESFQVPVEDVFKLIQQKDNWMKAKRGIKVSEPCFMNEATKQNSCEGRGFYAFKTEDRKLTLVACQSCFNSPDFGDYISSWMETDGDNLQSKLIEDCGLLSLNPESMGQTGKNIIRILKKSRKI